MGGGVEVVRGEVMLIYNICNYFLGMADIPDIFCGKADIPYIFMGKN